MREFMLCSTGTRRWLVGSLTLFILVVVFVVGYRRRADNRSDSPETVQPHVLSPQAVTVVPGIHLLGGLEPAAAYVVETSRGLVLIDAGLHAEWVKKEMASLGLDWRRIRAIFLTHVHGDHCGGAQELRVATGAKIYAGKGDAAILRAGEPRDAFFSTFYMPVATPGPTSVDVELSGEQTIVIGDTRFQAVATPGHTPGSMCYFMERGDRRILFSGDVVWSLSDDNIPLGTYSAHLAPRYRGDAQGFLSTLRRLRELPPPQLVLPGHPRLDSVPQSPTMTPKRWAELLDPGIREMEHLLARYARDGADFLDGAPKTLLPDLYYLGDFKNVAVYGFFASSKFFVVNAPGGAGLSDFLNARLKQLGRKPTAPSAVLLTSSDPEETAGLGELVEKYHPAIVAAPAAWGAIQKACPAVRSPLAPEDLSRKGWFSVTSIPLRGRGVGAVAYLMPWANKSVLLSGRIPLKVTHTTARALRGEVSQPKLISDYRASLQRLAEVKPDLWLPAVPADGQNANLYDREWLKILEENGAMFR